MNTYVILYKVRAIYRLIKHCDEKKMRRIVRLSPKIS
uniref:Uncharacterized protein n=1 Tax=Anguilla anguilla TaxID=7936 RepID=A0A0E9PMM1_ANGAN